MRDCLEHLLCFVVVTSCFTWITSWQIWTFHWNRIFEIMQLEQGTHVVEKSKRTSLCPKQELDAPVFIFIVSWRWEIGRIACKLNITSLRNIYQINSICKSYLRFMNLYWIRTQVITWIICSAFPFLTCVGATIHVKWILKFVNVKFWFNTYIITHVMIDMHCTDDDDCFYYYKK